MKPRLVSLRLSSLKETKPPDYVLRFLFGGICTAAAGLIAERFGPGVGGLFLAFPAIFPASASLIESGEKRRKREAGIDGTRRGRVAASVDAAGASMGAIGLVGFGLVLWKALPWHSSFAAIAVASGVWLAVSVALWVLRKGRVFRRRGRVISAKPFG